MNAAGTPVPARTVSANGEGPYADWHVTLRSDFSARMLVELQSGDVLRVMAAVDPLVVEHNFPDGAGALASSILDAVPWDAALTVVTRALGEIGKLPNR